MTRKSFCTGGSVAAIVAIALALSSASAEDAMPGMPGSAGGASTAAFAAAGEKMHKAMMVPLTGDADGDFARSMIPHHAGAIDMAKIELQYGRDPALRALAARIIDAQEREIALMQKWQRKTGR